MKPVKRTRPAFAQKFSRPKYPLGAFIRLGWDGFTMASLESKSGNTAVLALHPETTPAAVDWSMLGGVSVVVVEHNDIGHDYRHQLIRCLAQAGVRDCYLIPASRNPADALGINVGPRS